MKWDASVVPGLCVMRRSLRCADVDKFGPLSVRKPVCWLLSSPATPYSVVVGDVGTCDRRRGDDRWRVVCFGVRVVGGVRNGAVGGLRGHFDCCGQAGTGRNAIAPLTFGDRRRYQDSDARQNN